LSPEYLISAEGYMSHIYLQLREAQSHYDQRSSGLKCSAGNIILFQDFWTA